MDLSPDAPAEGIENPWPTRRTRGNTAVHPGAVPARSHPPARSAEGCGHRPAAVGVVNHVLQERSTSLSCTQGSGLPARAGSLEHPKVSLRDGTRAARPVPVAEQLRRDWQRRRQGQAGTGSPGQSPEPTLASGWHRAFHSAPSLAEMWEMAAVMHWPAHTHTGWGFFFIL